MKRSPGGATVQSLVHRQSPVAASVVLAARRPVPLPPAGVCVCDVACCRRSRQFDTCHPVITAAIFIRHISAPLCDSLGTCSHRRKLPLDPGAQAPHFCDVMCFSCSHWFYAMPTNRQSDHSFTAVVDIFGKGLNLPAPLDIQ